MKPILIFSLLIGVTFFCTAQIPNFTATVSSDTVNLSNVFEVVFTIEGERSRNFQQPEFLSFDMIYNNQSIQMNITNGESKRTVSHTFGLKAKEEGYFVIEKATVEIKGIDYSTDFIRITVDESYTPKALPKGKMDFWNPFEKFPKQEEVKPKTKKKQKIYKI